MTDQKKIIWISSSPYARNGFGTQTHIACRGLGLAGFDVQLIAMHRPQEAHSYVWELPGGETIQTDRKDTKIEGAKLLYHMLPHGVENMYGAKMLELYLQRERPDAICTLHDTQNVSFMAQIPNTTGIPWFHWLPWDNSRWEPDITRFFMESQCQIVLMSDFAERLAKEARFPFVDKIYHGVNTKVYKPPEDRAATKAKLFADDFFKGKFVVGYIGQNEERKHIDILLRAYAKFQKGKDDVRFFAHTDVEEPYPAHWSYKMNTLMEKLDIDEKWKHSPRSFFITKLSDQSMTDLYGSMDILGSATSGEGFGLMALYGNACGTPSVVTNINTTDQLLGGGKWGWPVPIATLYEAPGGYTRGMVNEDVMAGLFEDAYKNRDKLERFRKLAREDALRYDQDIIGKQWADLLAKRL